MISKIGYYLLLYPVSLLPLPVLYLFTDIFYLLLRTIIPYRRKVVRENIARSFPNKTVTERKQIERKFYRHLTDLLAEGTKNMSISAKELQRRFTVKNPTILEQLYQQEKNVLLVSGHYNNWEWLITAQNLLFSHQAVGIGMPLTSGFWDKKINERRARFGMNIIHSKQVNSYFASNTKKIATLILADQSPGDSLKCYWTDFLNQPTGVVFGPELLAHEFNHAVVFFVINKIKRGYYELELKLITDEPRKLEYGEITEQHVSFLEAEIMKNPNYWLWSHKRWKREVPENLTALRTRQREKFYARTSRYSSENDQIT